MKINIIYLRYELLKCSGQHIRFLFSKHKWVWDRISKSQGVPWQEKRLIITDLVSPEIGTREK